MAQPINDCSFFCYKSFHGGITTDPGLAYFIAGSGIVRFCSVVVLNG